MSYTEPLPPPAITSVPPITPISIPVEWTASPSPDVYYEISYKVPFVVGETMVGSVFEEPLREELQGLTPSSNYVICVRSVITRSGITAKSEPATLEENTRKFAPCYFCCLCLFPS